MKVFSYTVSKNVDLAKLNENKDIRVAKEKEQATQANAKRNKLIAIISAICIVVIVLSIVISNHSKKVNTYNEGIALLQSDSIDDINKGVEILLFELGDYKDSKEQIHKRAMEIVDEYPSKSVELLKKIGGHKDTINEIEYTQGLKLFDTGNFAEAFEKFENCGDYKDSKEKKQESLFYNYVIEANFGSNNIIIDGIEDVFNAKYLSGDELQNKIAGSWLCRYGNKAIKRTFNADGNITEYADYWKNDERVGKWTIENDELKYFGYSYKFYSMSNDVLVGYDPKTKVIRCIFIAQNSEIGKNCLEKYNIKLD